MIPTTESIQRAAELAAKYRKLKEWGVEKKLPFTKETQKDLDRFFNAARDGKLDVTEITAVTADVRRLEKYAEEFDAAKNVSDPFKQEKLRTTFDIENAAEELKAAKKVSTKADNAKSFAQDFAREGKEALIVGAKAVPWWAWAAGGVALVTYVLAQLATVSSAFGRKRE